MSLETNNKNNATMKAAISNMYGTQHVRIQSANRIGAAVRVALGMNDNTPKALRPSDEAKEQKEQAQLIKDLLYEYDLILSHYDSSRFMNETKFRAIVNDLGDQIQYTKDLFIYHMMAAYKTQLQVEETLVKSISQMVEAHPIWDGFLKDVTGCGPLMAAVCIAYLDPYKARHASAFWRYAGLDVVFEPYKKTDLSMTEENYELDPDDPVGSMEMVSNSVSTKNDSVFTKHVRIEWDTDREVYEADVYDAIPTETEIKIVTVGQKFTLPMKEKDTIIKATKRNGLKEDKVIPGARIIDYDIIDLEAPVDVPEGHYVGRAKRHTVDVQYIDKNGNTQTKKSITYNPTLKCKLVGVLGDSFMKCPGSRYEQIYRNYRHRLDNSASHIGKTNAHKHMMAKRYMIKMFLADLWVKWREIEGLPVSEPYAVAYLGKNPHGFNYDPATLSE